MDRIPLLVYFVYLFVFNFFMILLLFCNNTNFKNKKKVKGDWGVRDNFLNQRKINPNFVVSDAESVVALDRVVLSFSFDSERNQTWLSVRRIVLGVLLGWLPSLIELRAQHAHMWREILYCHLRKRNECFQGVQILRYWYILKKTEEPIKSKYSFLKISILRHVEILRHHGVIYLHQTSNVNLTAVTILKMRIQSIRIKEEKKVHNLKGLDAHFKDSYGGQKCISKFYKRIILFYSVFTKKT
jgi:hypothetical protein